MLKRPFAVFGFSMLVTFLIITNITHRMTIALLIGAVVIFSCFLTFKGLRKCLSVIFALFGAITFTIAFIGAEKYFLNETESFEQGQNLTGVVCEIPTESDYAFTYIIKPDGKNYKIRYVTESDIFLREGDCIKMFLANNSDFEEMDWLDNSLSSNIYFTFFEGDECEVEKTGEINSYYKNIGAVKRGFSEIVANYLPGRNGTIAQAMTIGDKTEIDRKIIKYFNYCGTSHLLVISGLHLSLWSVGIISLFDKSSKLRKYSPFIGLLCLFGYSSITGFSVSVIRAGVMVGAVLVGRLIKKDADSINSIGVAITGIVLLNPFAPYSVSFWLTFLSTAGLIVYAPQVEKWLHEKFKNKSISKIVLFDLLIKTIAISFSVMVFTLPVFIYEIKMISVVSPLTNFIMVNVALCMMVCTVTGVLCHLLFLKPIAKMLFLIIGVMGEYLHYFAEKIGMAEWSTISLNHRFYKYFFLFLAIGVIITLILKKYKVNIVKYITVVFSVLFCLVAIYCVCYEHNTPSVEIEFTSSKPIITVFSKGESVLVGLQKKKHMKSVEEMLNKHNEKKLDYIAVTENKNDDISKLITIYDIFGKSHTYFLDESPEIFRRNSESYVTSFTLSENIYIDISDENCIKIKTDGKSMAIVNCKKTENVYEKAKDCDIIILYNDNSEKIAEELSSQSTHSRVIVAEVGKAVSIYM